MKDKTGGSAYPTPNTQCADGHIHYGDPGMTLLDYFAGQVIQGMCASAPCLEWSDAKLAEEAYNIAAEMIRTRRRYL